MSTDNVQPLRDQGLADLHVHTQASDGIASVYEILDYVEQRTSLDIVAITDHDTIRGALEARETASKHAYRFQILTGVEISTNAGHLLGLFVEQTVPYDETKTLAYYVKAIHSMGGLCVVPHPISRQKNSISRKDIERLLADPDNDVHPDGIEVLEPRVARIVNTEDVDNLNRTQFKLAEVGGSDAHALSIIATRYTVFPGKAAQHLRQAILGRMTRGWSGPPPASV